VAVSLTSRCSSPEQLGVLSRGTQEETGQNRALCCDIDAGDWDEMPHECGQLRARRTFGKDGGRQTGREQWWEARVGNIHLGSDGQAIIRPVVMVVSLELRQRALIHVGKVTQGLRSQHLLGELDSASGAVAITSSASADSGRAPSSRRPLRDHPIQTADLHPKLTTPIQAPSWVCERA
jgi:hypothetical protein